MPADKKPFKPPPARNDALAHETRSAKDDTRVETNLSAKESEHARALDELNRKLDEALECTFPASDPFQL